MAGDSSRENGKKGGRPPGKKNPETLEREAVLKRWREQTMVHADDASEHKHADSIGWCSFNNWL
jgi:hypothetical protein